MNEADGDFDALRAHAKIDTHEKVCAERYGNINQSIIRLQQQIEAQGAAFHARLSTVSTRMWVFVGAVATAAVLMLLGGAGALIFHLLMRGMK